MRDGRWDVKMLFLEPLIIYSLGYVKCSFTLPMHDDVLQVYFKCLSEYFVKNFTQGTCIFNPYFIIKLFKMLITIMSV